MNCATIRQLLAAMFIFAPSSWRLERAAGTMQPMERAEPQCDTEKPVLEQPLTAEAKRLNDEVTQLFGRGRAAEAIAKAEQAVAIWQKRYPASTFPDGHVDLAISLNNLGFLYFATRQFDRALPYYERALAMNQKLYPASKYPNGQPAISRSLNNMGFLLRELRQTAKALQAFEQHLAMCEKLHAAAQGPAAHAELVRALDNVGYSLEALGQAGKALAYHEKALRLCQKLYEPAHYPDGHPDLAESYNRVGFLLRSIGRPEQAVPHLRKAVTLRKRLYPASRFPNGHVDLAVSLNNLGLALQETGQTDQAMLFHRQSLNMRRQLYPPSQFPDGHPLIATSINNLGLLFQAMGQPENALPHFREALEILQKVYRFAHYPEGHPHLAGSLNNVGFALSELGQADEALTYYRRSLEMRQRLFPTSKFPNGHPDLSVSFNNLGQTYRHMGQLEQALPYLRQSLQMRQALFPTSHFPQGNAHLAESLNNLGSLMLDMGQVEQALPYLRQGLQMRQSLFTTSSFPKGHPDLAASLSNLGSAFSALGMAQQAKPYYDQALAMNRMLFPSTSHPNGHPHFARALNNLGSVFLDLGQVELATPCYRDALAVWQKLHPAANCPDGHPDLAQGHNNLGNALMRSGHLEEALHHFSRGLEIRQWLFTAAKWPDGHPDVAFSLGNVGAICQALGRLDQAEKHLRQSLQLHQRSLNRELTTASEEAAFDKIPTQALACDAYLSVTHKQATLSDDVMASIWSSRAMITRLLEFRLAQARGAETGVRATLDRLRGLRLRTEQLLQVSHGNPTERDRVLADIAEERDRLERELISRMPALQRWRDLEKLTPTDLTRSLSPGSVFVDVIRYTRFEFFGAIEKRTPHYVGFLLFPAPRMGAVRWPVARIELGPAQPIDDAVAAWRVTIGGKHEVRGPFDAPAAATELYKLVWGRLAAAIPDGTTTVYLAPDGDLARMPWAALPIGNGQVLLEKYAFAHVPHAMFLFEHLRSSTSRASAKDWSLCAAGDIEYGASPWQRLPGTATEVKAIAAIAPGPATKLAGADATITRLNATLPQARYIHLATHGEFKADELTKERKRAQEALKSQLLGDHKRVVAAKNPLGYVGLVLSEGKVMSGLSIVDLDLSNTRLVTLSACETGLGEFTGGEGVQGLQRAFHLAGCPNVVASLWKVNDAATAALMAKFYHELWVNKKPPIEALREAQLTIYRHPELIPDLAGERGAPRLKEAVAIQASGAASARRATADTKLWAAFVLSGVGK